MNLLRHVHHSTRGALGCGSLVRVHRVPPGPGASFRCRRKLIRVTRPAGGLQSPPPRPPRGECLRYSRRFPAGARLWIGEPHPGGRDLGRIRRETSSLPGRSRPETSPTEPTGPMWSPSLLKAPFAGRVGLAIPLGLPLASWIAARRSRSVSTPPGNRLWTAAPPICPGSGGPHVNPLQMRLLKNPAPQERR